MPAGATRKIDAVCRWWLAGRTQYPVSSISQGQTEFHSLEPREGFLACKILPAGRAWHRMVNMVLLQASSGHRHVMWSIGERYKY